jgi:hypothetical protein
MPSVRQRIHAVRRNILGAMLRTFRNIASVVDYIVTNVTQTINEGHLLSPVNWVTPFHTMWYC